MEQNKVTPDNIQSRNSSDMKLEHSNARKSSHDDVKLKDKNIYPNIKSDLKMEHPNLDKMNSTAPMLPLEESEVKLPKLNNFGGKIFIREDTILTNLNGCAGCGRGQFTCTGVKKSWSVLCWGQHSEKKYYCLLLTLSAIFALSLLGTVFFCFTNTINDAILSNMVIRNNSLAFSIWRQPNVHPLMKVHIFNYTNWQNVKYGYEKTLKVEELGPYVYSQQLERTNIEFNKDKLSFRELSHFKYQPELSVGAHFDHISVPNIPLLSFFKKTSDIPFVDTNLINGGLWLAGDHSEAFINLPVLRFLWGYNDNIISMAQKLFPFNADLQFKQFGLLATKNNTPSEKFTINTGEVDKDRMNVIEKIDDMEYLTHWDDPECNSISATDGTIYPPTLLDKKQTLYVLMPKLCRRLPFVFKEEIEISNGVKLYRYKLPENVFDDPKLNPSNQCFCNMDSGVCPPQGVIDVSPCTMGAPIMMSFPHFERGDPKLQEDIQGLHPNANLHESYVDVHPTLGIVLQGKSSLQINIQVKNSHKFPAINYMEEGLILPVAWIEMGVEELPEALKSVVYHGTYSTAAVQLGLTVICVIALIVSSICLFLHIVQRRKKPCVTLKKIPIELISKIDVKQES